VSSFYATIQILTNVQQTTADVALKPVAMTLTAALPVPVNQDTPEMESPVQVIQLKLQPASRRIK